MLLAVMSLLILRLALGVHLAQSSTASHVVIRGNVESVAGNTFTADMPGHVLPLAAAMIVCAVCLCWSRRIIIFSGASQSGDVDTAKQLPVAKETEIKDNSLTLDDLYIIAGEMRPVYHRKGRFHFPVVEIVSFCLVAVSFLSVLVYWASHALNQSSQSMVLLLAALSPLLRLAPLGLRASIALEEVVALMELVLPRFGMAASSVGFLCSTAIVREWFGPIGTVYDDRQAESLQHKNRKNDHKDLNSMHKTKQSIVDKAPKQSIVDKIKQRPIMDSTQTGLHHMFAHITCVLLLVSSPRRAFLTVAVALSLFCNAALIYLLMSQQAIYGSLGEDSFVCGTFAKSGRSSWLPLAYCRGWCSFIEDILTEIVQSTPRGAKSLSRATATANHSATGVLLSLLGFSIHCHSLGRLAYFLTDHKFDFSSLQV